MKAEKKPNYDNNRKKLSEIIPLDTPFSVYIEQTRYCNFKCFYCIHSTRDEENGEFQKLGYEIKHMTMEMAEDIINELKKFPNNLKKIVFSGLGEPLANPNLPKIIKKVVDSKIAERVEIITNGLLLKPKLIDELVNTGMTHINISIQGITEEHYLETCGVKINLDRLIENLTYLYKNKKQVQIYIKIIDAILKDKGEEELFYKMFGNICDRIYIEHLIVMQQQMNDLREVVDENKNFYGEEIILDRKICSQSFYYLQIGCDGDVFPCPVPGLPKTLSMGNIKEQSIIEIWNGEKRKKILKGMLKFEKDKYESCRNCKCFNAVNDPLEYLDDVAEDLLKKF